MSANAETAIAVGETILRIDRASNVLQARYGLKMVGVDAAAHAAEVIELQPSRNRTALHLVGDAMCNASTAAGKLDAPVAALVDLADPEPAAGIWLWRNSGSVCAEKIHGALHRSGLDLMVLTSPQVKSKRKHKITYSENISRAAAIAKPPLGKSVGKPRQSDDFSCGPFS